MRKRAILSQMVCTWLVLAGMICWSGCTTSEESTGGGPGGSGTQIFGTKTGVLSSSDSPYWVTGDLVVPAGESLTIDPGVELRFDGLHKFLVQGRLQAVGTAEQNIVFTSMSGALGAGDLGQWRSIVFDTHTEEVNGDTSELAYCLIEFGASSDTSARYPEDSTGIYIFSALFCWDSSPNIHNCTIVRNGYHGVLCTGDDSDPYLLNNIITENDGDGIRCQDGATARIWYNDVYLNSTREFADTPDGIGVMTQLNVNRDSCDFQYNISLNPDFEDIDVQDYDLTSCSPCIGTGQGGLHIGSMPYYVGDTELRGPIGGSVLTAAASPWYVSCDVFIEPGETLTIQSGTQVLIQGLYEIRISGLLEADGATFMPEDTTGSNRWKGILFTEDADPASHINDCVLLDATTPFTTDPYGGAITVQGVSPDISNNTIENSEYCAISCQNGAQPVIAYNVIEGFGTAGIYCYNNSRPDIHHNVIHDGMGYGIWCNYSSSATIMTNLIYSTSYIGIKCQQQSSPLIEYNTITDHDYTGVECQGWSNPTIRNNIIAFNGILEKMNQSGATNAYGNGINVKVSSSPSLSYNDVYVDTIIIMVDSVAYYYGNAYGGTIPDSTSISLDPLFVNAASGNYHLQSNSPCLNAASDGGQIGAYGLGDW